MTAAQTENKLAELVVLVIGDNQCWGKAATIKEALAFAYRPKRWVAYIVHRDSQIHEVTGQIMYPDGYKPMEIDRRGKK